MKALFDMVGFVCRVLRSPRTQIIKQTIRLKSNPASAGKYLYCVNNIRPQGTSMPWGRTRTMRQQPNFHFPIQTHGKIVARSPPTT